MRYMRYLTATLLHLKLKVFFLGKENNKGKGRIEKNVSDTLGKDGR